MQFQTSRGAKISIAWHVFGLGKAEERRKIDAMLVCLQDGVFSASYSGATQPFSPAAFLHAWWRHADHHLASYQQQDAHEFYLYALAGLGQSRALEEESAPAPALAQVLAPEQASAAALLLPQPRPELKQEADDVASHMAHAQRQAPLKQEGSDADGECLLVPSRHALHASLAEPLGPGSAPHPVTLRNHRAACLAGVCRMEWARRASEQ